MDKGIIYKAIESRKVIIFFALAVVVFGLYSYYAIPKQENPDMNAPIAMMTVIYPGASPEEVEKNVTAKIEEELIEINGYDRTESYSRNSISKVILWLDNDADVDKAWAKLRQKMDELESFLPEGCSDIEVNTDLAESAGMIISLSGNSYSYDELATFAEEIKDELAGIKGVSRLEIVGKQEKEVHVDIDYARFLYTRLSLEDVVKILALQNMEIPSGEIHAEEARINVRTSAKYTSLKEIEDTILDISSENGMALRLKDIARVSMQEEDSSYRIKENGKNAVLLTGYFQENKNIVLIGNRVEKKLQALKERFPEDLNIKNVAYQPRDVHESATNFMNNLLLGVFFVAVVVFFGMGWRNATIISTAIPLSILLAFGAMNLLNLKLHQITIAGLIVSMGMLVDNAIVISDAIQVRVDCKEERLKACVLGTAGVSTPVFTSTLTTVAAFVPLLILPGVAGEYIRGVPQIVILALTSSFLVATLFTPTIAFFFFKEGGKERDFGLLRHFFDNLLNKALHQKKIVFLIIAVTLVLTFILASNLPLVFFPKADKNIIYINISAEQPADLAKTEAIVTEVENILQEQEEVTSYTSAIGSGLPKFFMTVPHAIQSQDYAQILLELDLHKGNRFRNNTQFADYLQGIIDAGIAGGTVTVAQLELAEPVEAPVQVLVTGKEYEQLVSTADLIGTMLKEIEGTINVRDDGSDEVYEYLVEIDDVKAPVHGLSKYDIQKEINIALKGEVASVFSQGGEEYRILVKSNVNSKEALENLAIKSSRTGNKVLLKQVAEVTLDSQLPTIKHYDREKTVKVLSDVKFGYSAVTVQDILEKKLQGHEKEENSIVFNGEREKIKYHFSNLRTASVFAVLIIYIIMLIQFKSLVQPLVIISTIPLSVIGSVAGLLMFRQPLSFTALLGMVSLMGVVVNNAIIMLDYINYERRKGKQAEQACRDAVEKRFRPIFMTTATTVLGLIPLAMSGTLFVPMAVALMSGLMVATLLTLVVIPVVYAALEERKLQLSTQRIYSNIMDEKNINL